jgi:hypothetical protein
VFEEFCFKLVIVADEKGIAIRNAKAMAFYQHTGFEGATSHVDDKYGIDVEDAHEIIDILPPSLTETYAIDIGRNPHEEEELHLGYFPLAKWKGMG